MLRGRVDAFSRQSRRRAALTLVEVLVVIAIIGLLIGLCLPAIQKVRESACRASCKNNLRQIGLALQQHVDCVGTFPPGISYRDGTDPKPFLSWHARILPFVERDADWRLTE